MQACVYADTAFKNGEYSFNGTIWAKNMAVGGLIPVIPTSVSGTGVSLGAYGTVLCSASAAINMDGVFTTDYDDYRVVITGNTSVAANVTGFMRASGANITGAVYGYQYLQAVGATSTASNSSGATNWPFHTGSTGEISVVLELHSPASASRNTRGESTSNVYTSGTQTLSHFAVRRGATAAEDGMSVNVSTGTFTGEVKIFAYSH
jgi:hypothetical protein